ncbi:MAG TPA: glutathione S-transferase [Gammaproteobacteria bacterium]|nr:glutathione S-transferase [Gammaproteobacteria bacterium]
MLTVHHLNNSRSQRILWLLEELGVDYEIVRYERDPKTMLAPASLKKIHPLGKAPVITDGDVTMAESGAIIEYLLARYGNGQLAPAANTQAYWQYRQWLHYAEGSVMPLLLMSLVFSQIPRRVPFFIKPIGKAISSKVQQTFIQPRLTEHLDYQENALTTSGWFAGDTFTAADIQMSFAVEGAKTRGILTEKHPHLNAWLDKIHARPAYSCALEKGGPYDLLN